MLKVNYKDDIIESGISRKYIIENNTDGSVSFEDATEYAQIGDDFCAKDINATNKAINKLNNVTSVTLYNSQWVYSNSVYVQSVDVDGITVEDNPILLSALADGASSTTQKSYNKAFGLIASGTAVTYDGYIIFKAYKKPEIDIKVNLKGV